MFPVWETISEAMREITAVEALASFKMRPVPILLPSSLPTLGSTGLRSTFAGDPLLAGSCRSSRAAYDPKAICVVSIDVLDFSWLFTAAIPTQSFDR